MFIGRRSEIAALNAFYEGDNRKVACITGSLGMGKTTLLREFARDKSSLYFCCYETTGQQEISLFAQAVGLKRANGLEAVLDKITTMAKKEKILLILDQYPNFAKADTTFGQTLLQYFTNQWKDLPVKLVLCGDGFLSMEKYVYGKKAIWAKMLDVHLTVKGMSFMETKEFFPGASGEDAALYYGISGGIPAHLVRMQGRSTKDAAREIFDITPGKAALLPEQVMATELRELSYYNCILSAMAQGMNRVNQLSAAVNKPKDVVVPYLNALMSIGIVTKETPITEETNRKKTRYSIVNSNIVFWYRYLVPHMELCLTEQWDTLWDEVIVPDLDSFMQQVFIDISREYIEGMSQKGQMPFSIEKSGNWWVNDDEAGTTEGFDIVSVGTADGKTATIFTLCFYEDRAIEVAELKWMIDMTRQMHREGDVYYVVCTKDRFHENVETVASTIKNIILVTLKDEMLF
ncbi:MAG: DUF234 domain-containing protein [Lachnospiraceae bacterium]|nr:DUF234 domain-containing protein [Lachnospiraceae bacterium]